MPEINTLYIDELSSTSVELAILTPLIERTISIQIVSTASDAKAQPAAIKNVFKILLSFDLNATTIEKSIIERNIKNSTITKTTKRIRTKTIEKLPEMAEETKSFSMLINPGPAYEIKSETTKVAKAASISINAVKYFELIS
jgi:hypothetical protein